MNVAKIQMCLPVSACQQTQRTVLIIRFLLYRIYHFHDLAYQYYGQLLSTVNGKARIGVPEILLHTAAVTCFPSSGITVTLHASPFRYSTPSHLPGISATRA